MRRQSLQWRLAKPTATGCLGNEKVKITRTANFFCLSLDLGVLIEAHVFGSMYVCMSGYVVDGRVCLYVYVSARVYELLARSLSGLPCACP